MSTKETKLRRPAISQKVIDGIIQACDRCADAGARVLALADKEVH